MPVTPAQLTLTADQKDNLLQIGVDVTKVHLVSNHEIKPGLPLDGYTTGHYLMFVEGTTKEQLEFYKIMYFTTAEPELEIKIPGLWVYATPSARFAKEADNLVTVS